MTKADGWARTRILPLMIIICLILWSQGGWAWETKEDTSRFNASFLGWAGRDLAQILTAPARWEGKDWLGFAAVAGTGILLFTQDDRIRDLLQDQENRGGTADDIGSFIRPFGKGGALFGLLAGTYLTGELLDRDSLRRTALMGLQSWLTAGTIVTGIKLLSGRSRPNTGLPKDDIKPLAFSKRRLSFPSGDTASAFAVATIIAGRTRNLGIDILAYSVAGLVGFYRMYDDKHWMSDVFVGAVIGYAVGRKIQSLHRARARPGSARLSLSPFPGGMTLSLSF
jgi:membrane-associated phospholipid phosphatase